MGNASSFVESSRFEDLKAGDLIAIKMNGDLFEGRLTKFNVSIITVSLTTFVLAHWSVHWER